MSPIARSWKALEGVNIRRALESSNLPIEIAVAIADLCESSTERIAEADKQANDARMAAGIESLSANYWKSKAESSAPEAGLIKDAERYRWIRDKSLGQFEHPICVTQKRVERGMQYVGPLVGKPLDEAIDAAITPPPQPHEPSEGK